MSTPLVITAGVEHALDYVERVREDGIHAVERDANECIAILQLEIESAIVALQMLTARVAGGTDWHEQYEDLVRRTGYGR